MVVVGGVKDPSEEGPPAGRNSGGDEIRKGLKYNLHRYRGRGVRKVNEHFNNLITFPSQEYSTTTQRPTLTSMFGQLHPHPVM